MTKIINLTPHELNIVREDGKIKNIPASGDVARLKTEIKNCEPIYGFAVRKQQMGAITGLPESKEGTIFIVSSLVMLEAKRSDVFAPGTAIRDEEGRIIGSDGLSAHPNI